MWCGDYPVDSASWQAGLTMNDLLIVQFKELYNFTQLFCILFRSFRMGYVAYTPLFRVGKYS